VSVHGATWFDGRAARGVPARAEVDGPQLVVHGDDGSVLCRARIAEVELSEPFVHAPRFAYFRDGATLEVHDAAPFTRALADAGRPPALVARLQRSWPLAVGALAVLLGGFVFAYVRGIPAAARWLAFALPPSVEERIGEQVEKTLNLEMLMASRLPPERTREIAEPFARAARRAAPDVRYTLKARSVQEGPGINAFALPGGTIVLLDGLVNAAPDDRQVLAVLGHELGHVAHKHGLRNVLQALGFGALAGVVWGDFAGVAANVPVIFGVLRYSREFEAEADAFAVHVLRADGQSAQPLIDFFEWLAAREQDEGHAGLPDFLSTHPSAPDRIERLRRLSGSPPEEPKGP
jgi:Zn-dependent protease with chaperone function